MAERLSSTQCAEECRGGAHRLCTWRTNQSRVKLGAHRGISFEMTPESNLREAIVEAIETLTEALAGIESPESEDEMEEESPAEDAGEEGEEPGEKAPVPALVAALRG